MEFDQYVITIVLFFWYYAEETEIEISNQLKYIKLF
jgi:hypothetical protein